MHAYVRCFGVRLCLQTLLDSVRSIVTLWKVMTGQKCQCHGVCERERVFVCPIHTVADAEEKGFRGEGKELLGV